MKRTVCLVAASVPLVGATLPEPTSIVLEINGLRSQKGRIEACMTANPKAFPDCQKDPKARRLTAPAINGETMQFTNVAPGRYAIALFHDENGNGRMDTLMFVPREGFGFSRDAPLKLGPPRFAAAAFDVGSAPYRTAIHVRYML